VVQAKELNGRMANLNESFTARHLNYLFLQLEERRSQNYISNLQQGDGSSMLMQRLE
jgi:hypothetical protein